MEGIGELGYVLSRPEMICLAALAGADIILGFADNTAILSRDEILALWPGVKNSLRNKQYVDEGEDDSLKIDEGLFRCVSVCANPRVYISSSKGREPCTEEFSFYADYGLCVKLTESKSIKDALILTPITLYSSIRNMFLDFFVPDEDYIAGGKPVLFSKEEFQSAEGAQSDTDDNEKETAGKVLHSNKSPHSLIKMRLDNIGVSKTSVYTVYIGESTIWRRREVRNREELVTLEPLNKGELVADIFEQINALKYFLRETAASSSSLDMAVGR